MSPSPKDIENHHQDSNSPIPPSYKTMDIERKSQERRTPSPIELGKPDQMIPAIYILEIETIYPYPYVRPPWWTLPATVHIEPNKKAAKQYHDHNIVTNPHSPMLIYTDTSSINGNIGAGVFNGTRMQKSTLY
jgi:hypothetical protein